MSFSKILKAIPAYNQGKPFPRYDRYENKQLYWIEEETEAEWEKTRSKATISESQYEANVSAASVMGESLETLEFGPSGGPDGGKRGENMCLVF